MKNTSNAGVAKRSTSTACYDGLSLLGPDHCAEVISTLPLSEYTPAWPSTSRSVLANQPRCKKVLASIGTRLFALILLMGTLASAQAKPALKPHGVVIPPAQNASTLTVEVVPLPDSSQMRVLTPERGVLDLGSVSVTGRSNPQTSVRKTRKSMILTSEFALRVNGEPGLKPQPVTISGFVTHASAMQQFRVNGQPLSATPVVIARNIAIGTITRHKLEIEIPFSSTEADANVNVSLGFTVSTNPLRP